MTRKRSKRTTKGIKLDSADPVTGVAKELYLVGLYGVKELTGADFHHKPRPKKQPWQKKWGER